MSTNGSVPYAPSVTRANCTGLEGAKRADIALLEGNPLEDISALKSVRMTIRNGEILYRKTR